MDLNILYEDNHIIVCVKKPGVLSQAGPLDMPDMLSILKAYIKEKYQKPGNVFLGLVHRLDLNVGGVMVFARTSKAARRLSQQVRDHQFNKQYFAVVKGDLNVEQQSNILENYMKKDQKERLAIITDNDFDQYAKLIYQTLEVKESDKGHLSLVNVELVTGRFHQIRAQFAYVGHPLYGDNKYGPKTKGYELGLYAYQLSFIHPTLKENMTFFDYPSDGIFRVFNMFSGSDSNDSERSN